MQPGYYGPLYKGGGGGATEGAVVQSKEEPVEYPQNDYKGFEDIKYEDLVAADK